VNTNYTDIINGFSDGTKDLNMSAATLGGTLTANGHVTLGSNSADDLTVNASLASSIPIKTTRTYDIGSADLGLRIAYLGMNSTYTIALCGPSSGASADYTLTLPATAPVVGQAMVATSTSAVGWAPNQYDINAVASADYTITDTDGYSLINVTTGASNRTITLPTAADNSDRVIIIKKVDSGTGTVIIDGEGSETIDGATTYTLYFQYDSAVVKCDGSNWHTLNVHKPPTSQILVDTPNGHGSTDTKIRRYTNATTVGTAITRASSAGNGDTFTVSEAGIYSLYAIDLRSGGASDYGFSLNSADLTTSITGISVATRIAMVKTISADWGALSATLRLAAGDVVRVHSDGNLNTTAAIGSFRITQVARL
jgi:hypothetical protein